MKLRIIKKEDEFVPQYYNKRSSSWFECNPSGEFCCNHYTLDEAKEVIEEFKKMHPKPEVVWEEEY